MRFAILRPARKIFAILKRRIIIIFFNIPIIVLSVSQLFASNFASRENRHFRSRHCASRRSFSRGQTARPTRLFPV